MNLVKETKKIPGIISCDICLVTTSSDKMYKNEGVKKIWEPKWYCTSCAQKVWMKNKDVNLIP